MRKTICIFVSAVCLIYITIASLGVTGSYLQAINMGATCWAFWLLGKQCGITKE